MQLIKRIIFFQIKSLTRRHVDYYVGRIKKCTLKASKFVGNLRKFHAMKIEIKIKMTLVANFHRILNSKEKYIKTFFTQRTREKDLKIVRKSRWDALNVIINYTISQDKIHFIIIASDLNRKNILKEIIIFLENRGIRHSLYYVEHRDVKLIAQ